MSSETWGHLRCALALTAGAIVLGALVGGVAAGVYLWRTE